MNTLNATPFATYTYGADGNRVRKTFADGTFTEYVYFNGQPIAEKDAASNWTDYIYANGKKIAKVLGAEQQIAVSLNAGGGGTWQWFDIGMLHGYMIKPGDKISWRQFQSATARGGIVVETSSGGETVWSLQDQNGSFINSGSVTGQWDDRTADLSGLAGGAISLMGVGLDTATTGSATIQFADMAIFSTDGTVTPIFNGGSAAFTRGIGNNSMANAQASVGSYPASPAATHFFIGDHLGTAQMEFAAGGWPVWQGQFAPYGQEIQNGSILPPDQPNGSTNHYKFTGKERDAESGLDYFTARYYASSMGRFMSPDWAEKAEPVPYAKLADPQTLNLYTYGLNNPLNYVDDDGHFSKDSYVADNDKHGGPHIDRYNKQGKNVGRYKPDGTPLKHNGKTPSPVPNSDEDKFQEAKKDLKDKQMQDAQDFINKQPPIPTPTLPEGLKPDPTPNPSQTPPDLHVTPLPMPPFEPLPPMPMPMPMPEPIPVFIPFLLAAGSISE